jgi:hypothetical protein
MYCSKDTDDCGKESQELKNLLENIFYKYSVNLVVSGHLHNYER